MNNVDKGRLLAVLFPEKVQAILDHIAGAYQFLSEHDDTLRGFWNNETVAFDFWYRQAHEVADIIRRHKKPLAKSSTLFAEQLFGGYHALFTIDCIVKQAEALPPLPENVRYGLCVKLLFDHYTITP